jgi:hypothetical protein
MRTKFIKGVFFLCYRKRIKWTLKNRRSLEKRTLGPIYLLIMNKDTWNNFSKEDQQAIQRATETAYKTLGSIMNKSFDTRVKDMKNDGVNI